MVITIIYNWTDDEPSTSTADKDKEPDPDENRTDLENRKRRDDTEGHSFQAHWNDVDPWLEYSPQNDAMHKLIAVFECSIYYY